MPVARKSDATKFVINHWLKPIAWGLEHTWGSLEESAFNERPKTVPVDRSDNPSWSGRFGLDNGKASGMSPMQFNFHPYSVQGLQFPVALRWRLPKGRLGWALLRLCFEAKFGSSPRATCIWANRFFATFQASLRA